MLQTGIRHFRKTEVECGQSLEGREVLQTGICHASANEINGCELFQLGEVFQTRARHRVVTLEPEHSEILEVCEIAQIGVRNKSLRHIHSAEIDSERDLYLRKVLQSIFGQFPKPKSRQPLRCRLCTAHEWHQAFCYKTFQYRSIDKEPAVDRAEFLMSGDGFIVDWRMGRLLGNIFIIDYRPDRHQYLGNCRVRE